MSIISGRFADDGAADDATRFFAIVGVQDSVDRRLGFSADYGLQDLFM